MQRKSRHCSMEEIVHGMEDLCEWRDKPKGGRAGENDKNRDPIKKMLLLASLSNLILTM